MMTMGLMIEARNLVKRYSDKAAALAGVSLNIESGTCFGLLGPNGAGKTTLLKLLCGLIEPTEGELFVLGMSSRASGRQIRSRIGVVPQGDGLDPELSVAENLLVTGAYFGLEDDTCLARARNLLRWAGLESREDSSPDELSGGLRRRLSLVRAQINDPELFLLDEPTVGLDPVARQWTWDFIENQKKQGRTLVLTTHYLEEAEALCDQIALIDKGVIFEQGSPKEIVSKYWGSEVVEFQINKSEAGYYTGRLKTAGFQYQLVGTKIIVATQKELSIEKAMSLVKGVSVQIRKPNLNDVFMKVAGASLQESEFV